MIQPQYAKDRPGLRVGIAILMALLSWKAGAQPTVPAGPPAESPQSTSGSSPAAPESPPATLGSQPPGDEAPRVTLESWVDPPEVPLNQTVRFIVRLNWVGRRGQIEVVDVAAPSCTGLQVVSSSQENRTESTGGKQVSGQEISFLLQPEELGMATIKPLRVRYRIAATGEEESLYTTRQSVKVIDPVENAPRNWLPGLLLIGGGIFLLAIIGTVLVRQRRGAPAAPEKVPEPTPAERALTALKKAPDLRLAGHLKDYHALIADAVRQYLAERYGLPAREQPTEWLLSHLEEADGPAFPAPRIALVREVLEACDLVKFAGAVPEDSAMERVWRQAQEAIQQEPPEPEGEPEDSSAA